MVSKYLSDKIRVLSFVSILFVLYIHSSFHQTEAEILGMQFNNAMQVFISSFLGQMAVPLFFMISGFLFFNNVSSIEQVFNKITKRIKTLLIPFVIAAVIYTATFIVLAYLPVQGFMNGNKQEIFEILNTNSILTVLRVLFIDKGNGSPLAFHLWYLRDLIGIVVISPILFFIRRKVLSSVFLLLLLFISYSVLKIIGLKMSLILSVFWFVLGSFMITNMPKIDSKIVCCVLFITFILLCTFGLYLPEMVYAIVKVPIIFYGIVIVWNIYDLFANDNLRLGINRERLLFCCGFTFFIYLYHMPFLNVIRKLLVAPFGHSAFGFAFSYLVSPVIFATLAILIGCLLKKVIPSLYNIIVGGR